MDASTGAKSNGNGHADPSPVSLPSAVAAPTGAPVSSAIPAPAAGAPEPLVVVDDDARDPATGQIKKGKTLNPKGRPPGIPNKNTEFLRLLTTKELREVWMIAKKQARAGKIGLIEFLLARALVPLTSEAAGVVINNNPSASAAVHNNLTHDRLEELRDPGVVVALGDLADRLSERRRVTRALGGNGN